MYIHLVIHFFLIVRKLACNSSKIFSEEDIQKHLHLHICSENNFPTAAGLASSASGFACLGISTDSIQRLPPFIHPSPSFSPSISPSLPPSPSPSLPPSFPPSLLPSILPPSLPPSLPLLFFIHLSITSSLSISLLHLSLPPSSLPPSIHLSLPPSLHPPSLPPSISLSLQPSLYVYLSLFLSLFPVYAIAQVYGLQNCELSAIARYVTMQALSSSIPLLYPDKVQAVHVGVCMVDLLSGREDTLMEKEVLQYRFGITST